MNGGRVEGPFLFFCGCLRLDRAARPALDLSSQDFEVGDRLLENVAKDLDIDQLASTMPRLP